MEYEGPKSTPLLKLATPKTFQTELENTPIQKIIRFFCTVYHYTTSDLFEINKGKGYKSWYCHEDVVVVQFQSRHGDPNIDEKNTSRAFPNGAENQKFQRFNLHDPTTFNSPPLKKW